MKRPIEDIHIRSPFRDLFPIDGAVLKAVFVDMKVHGYDHSKPVDVWRETDVCVDGHTRILAARNAGLTEVEVYEHSFPNEEAALAYAIHNQRDRRNLTDADIMRCVAVMDERRQQGERTDLASTEAKSGKSSEHTAEVVGTSRAKVEKARTVLDHADGEMKQAVLDGEKSIHRAYVETQEQRREDANRLMEPELAEGMAEDDPPSGFNLQEGNGRAKDEAEEAMKWRA